MQVIIPQEEKKKLHPMAIFRQACLTAFKNFKSFILPYAVIYLPILALTILGIAIYNPDKQTIPETLVSMAIAVLGCLGAVVMINIAKRASAGEPCNFSQSFQGSWKNLLSYLGATIILALTLGAITIAGVMSATLAGRLLWDANQLLSLLLIIICVVAVVAGLVYFCIRWALYGIICVLEAAGPVASLKLSMQTVREQVDPLVAVALLLFALAVLFMAPVLVAGLFLDRATLELVSLFYNVVSRLFLLPIWACLFVDFYKAAKIEKVEAITEDVR